MAAESRHDSFEEVSCACLGGGPNCVPLLLNQLKCLFHMATMQPVYDSLHLLALKLCDSS